MNLNFRRFILRLIPYLQRPPLVWPLALYYRLAVAAAVRAVRGLNGVIAVYLSGSLARGEPIYGLSDIDLKIVVAGGDDQALARRIRTRLRRLALPFPILGSYSEKGVFFEATLAGEVRRYPLLRHLFDRDFYPDRLLWGEDVLGGSLLPPPTDEERLLAYLWKAKYWLEKFFVFAEAPQLCRRQRLYLAAKAVGNCGQLLARVEDGEGELVDLVGGYTVLSARLDPSQRPSLDRLLADRQRLFRGSILETSDVFPVFMEAVGMLVRAIHQELVAGEGESTGPVPRIVGEGWRPPSAEEASWRGVVAAACPEGCEIDLLPPAMLGVSALDFEDVDRPIILIQSGRRLGFATLLGLRRTWREHLEGRAQLVVQDNPDFLYPVHTDLLEHWLCTAVEDQQLLHAAHNSQAPLGRCFVHLMRGRLEDQLSQVEDLTADPAIRRLPDGKMTKFVAVCLRNLALLSEIRSDRFELAADSESAVRQLERNGWLTSGEAGHMSPVAEGQTTRAPQSSLSLVGDLATALAEGTPAARRTVEPRQNANGVTVSVVVITRNRAEQLRRCLDALAVQTRDPEELIVIDNGSIDHTREVVETFAGNPRPIYRCEPNVGYGRARNAGVAAAVGEVIAFVDDDAVVRPEWLEMMVRPFLRDPSIGIAGGSIRTLEEERKDPVYRYHVASEGGPAC